jgi:hypothetical protein
MAVPLPPGFELESRGDYDPLGPLLKSGIEATNGYRTPEDIQRLKREGYTPAPDSDHLRGDAVDLVPGKSGWNLKKLAVEARKQFGPEAQIGIHNGTHVHVSLKGWGQAPGTPGTPRSGLPPVPDGFEVEQRGALDNAAIAKTDPSVTEVAGFRDELKANPKGAEQFHDALYQAASSGQIKSVADAQAWASEYNKANGTDFGVADSDLSRKAIAAAVAGQPFSVELPQMSQGQAARMQQRIAETNGSKGAAAVLGAEDAITLGANDEIGALIDAGGDFLSGKGFDYTGNLNATRGYIDAVQGEHPNYYLGGQIAGGVLVPAVGDMSSLANLAKVGAVEGGIYGFNEADGSLADRGAGAAIGAGAGAVAAPALGAAFNAATPVVRRILGREAAGAPVEGEVAPEAVIAPEAAVGPESAAMAAERGPSITGEVPVNRVAVEPGTEEQRAVAAQVQPEDVVAPSSEVAEPPPLSEVAKAGNINLSRIETPEDIDALMKFTADTFGGFNEERRGVQSWEATEALAKDLGMTPDDLLARRTGEAFNAEQAHAARGILSASAAETRNLADKALTGTAEDKAAFVKSFLLHAAITEKASGAAAEAGRALNIYRKVSKASLGDRAAIQEAVKRLQSGASVEDVAAMVNSLADDPTALNRFARDAIKPRFRDKLLFVWINSLLSGPKTHVVNMSSNLLTAVMGLPEHALAAAIGKLHGGDKVFLSEIGPRFYGMMRGGAESLSAAIPSTVAHGSRRR